MTLDLYFARRFLRAFAVVGAGFAGLILFIDIVELIGEVPGAGGARLLGLAALKLPASLYQVMPLLMMLSAVALFLGLSRSSEMVVTRAAGRSVWRGIAGPLIAALVIGMTAVALLNPIVASSSRAFEDRKALLSGAQRQVVSLGRDGVWLREGDADGQLVVNGRGANLDGTILHGVSVLRYDAQGRLISRILATSATLRDGAWVLRDTKSWPLTAQNPEVEASTAEQLTLPSTLTADRIRDTLGEPAAIGVWDMPAFVEQMRAAGLQARRHLVWFHSELALPVFLLAMVLVGAAFTVRHQRAGRTGIMVLAAVLTGFALYFVRNLAMILGENGQIPVVAAAWIPPIAAVMLGLGLLLYQEDG